MSARSWVLLLAAVLLLMGGWYFWGQFQEQTEEIKDLEVELSLQGIELVKGGADGKKWKLKAKKAKYSKHEETIDLISPELTFYLPDSDKTIRVQAPKGKANQKDNQAELWPEVKADYVNSTVYTRRLHYRGNQSKAELTGGVKITGQGLTALSKQGEIDLKSEVINLQGKVEVFFHEEIGPDTSSNP